MKLLTVNYQMQSEKWVQSGRHIMAQYDETSIVVYQAYPPSIGRYAAEHRTFGGGFSFDRMSWIKPNFLWMMYRSGWGTKSDQETTLAIFLKRSGFDEILTQAVHSRFEPEVYSTEAEWKRQLANSDVRLQWDPDHDPAGNKLERRAIQLGLRDAMLKRYANEFILDIINISEYVQLQEKLVCSEQWSQLATPYEQVYSVSDFATARKLMLTGTGTDH